MTEAQVFNSAEFGSVRVIQEDDTLLFCGADVAKALGYSNPNKAINNHCRAITKRDTPISGKMQAVNFIPEGDVYRLIVHSKLASAEKFERWLFEEVLPSIRKHGAYMTPETLEAAILNPDVLIRLCRFLKTEQDHRRALEAANSLLTVENVTMKPKAEYFDQLVDRNLLTSFRKTAKALEVREKDFDLFAGTQIRLPGQKRQAYALRPA